MFDNYHVNRSPSDVHVNITEKRAPTDQSVALLREMEAEAQKRIKDVVRVESSGFECVLHAHDDLMNDRKKVMAIFSINGKKMEARFDCDAHCDNMQEKIMVGIRDAAAKEIANLIAPAFDKLGKRNW